MNAKHALLVDGLGACASVLLLGFVLPAMQPWIGMPTRILYLLAGIAALFAASSLSGYRFAGDHATRWLRAVMVANLLYCLLTCSLVALHLGELTAGGVAYFVAEAAVILGLVWAELQVLRRDQGSRGGPRSV